VASQAEEKRKNNIRKKARRLAIKEGRVKLGSGKDVDHKRPLSKGGSNTKKNTRVISRATNRSEGGKVGGKAVTGKPKRDAGSLGGKASSRKGVPNKK
jgi:hypothetical protein